MEKEIKKEIKTIAELFAADIKKYISLGGKLDDLNASKVYETINKEENPSQ